jgi:hypothetical protein
MIKSIPEYPLEGMPYYKRAQYWVALTNFSQEVKQGIPERIVIHDVTLRDGEQTPGVTFLEDERVRIAEGLKPGCLPYRRELHVLSSAFRAAS